MARIIESASGTRRVIKMSVDDMTSYIYIYTHTYKILKIVLKNTVELIVSV